MPDTPHLPNTKLRQMRLRHELTQDELAEGIARIAWETTRARVGVNGEMVGKWERGEKGVSRRYQRFLCKLFGTTLAGLGFRAPSADLSGEHAVQIDPIVARSQTEWREVRRYLNGNRATLADTAAGLYSSDAFLGPARLISCPEWMPAEPVDLAHIELTWGDDPGPATLDGTEPEAHAVLPLRTPRYRYDVYTSAVRYVDRPRLFENRISYRLLDVSWAGGTGTMSFALASYFDKLDVAEAIGHELALAARGTTEANPVAWKDLPFRRLAEPFSLPSRYVIPAITTLTICRPSPGTDSPTFLLHWRDPAQVATAGGIYDVVPAGEFQPSSISPAAQRIDLDLWRNIVREYSEELCGRPEHDGSRGAALDYDRWPFYKAITRARNEGRIRAHCFGVGLDVLTLACTIPSVVVFDHDAFEEIFGEVVEFNAEGTIVSRFQEQSAPLGIPFTAEIVHRLLTAEPMAAPGAACLHLAWKFRDLLLGAPY